MPIQYTWICSATIPAGATTYSEIQASCVEDPVAGSEKVIQRIYPIQINTILVPTAPSIDYVVRIKKESRDGIIRPLADSLPASLINKLMSVSGQLPAVFTKFGKPAVIYIAPFEKVSVFVVNLASPTSATTVSFSIIAEKG